MLSIEHLKARTIKQMKRDVNDFLKEERIQLPTRESVASWIRRSADIIPKSIKRQLGSLGSLWDYLMAKGILSEMSHFQGHKLPKERKAQQNKRRAFTNDECLKLINAAKDVEDTVLFDLILLGLYTGARIEELCQLRVEDVVVEDKCRALRITKCKHLAGTRLVPIHPNISDLIDKLVATSRDDFFIFSKTKNQYDERSTGLSRRFGRLQSSLGYGSELVFHSLRKTLTTKLEHAGVPEGVAADIVGPEKQIITYGLYSGGTSMAQKMEALAKIRY